MSMTASQFKKVAQLLREVYSEIKQEAINSGMDLMGNEYDQLRGIARERVLENMGFTLQDYREAKAQISDFSQADMLDLAQEVKAHVTETIAKMVIPTIEQIHEIAHEVAVLYVKPPQITNQIVKEVTIEKPQIIKETVVEQTVKEVPFNDDAIKEMIGNLSERLNTLPASITLEQVQQYVALFFEDSFSTNFKSNIDVLGMPDFRKLGMGLREDVDQRVVGTSDNKTVPKITVSATAPLNPKLYDLWVDIS